MPAEEVAMEHQFFIRQQNLQLYRSLVAASEAAAAKADARQEKLLKLLVPVVNQIRTYWWCSPPRTGRQRMVPASLTARETGGCRRGVGRNLGWRSLRVIKTS